MIESYINKIISKPESFCYKDGGDHLREWQKDLVFYWSGEQEKADYSLYNSVPKTDKKPEIYTDGKFGSYSKIKSPLVFDSRNLESLEKNISINFWLGANIINGFYTVYLTPKDNLEFKDEDYSFSIQRDAEITNQVRLRLSNTDTVNTLLNKLLFELDPSIYGVEIDLDQSSENMIAIKSSSPGKKFNLFDGTDGLNLLDLFDIEINYGFLPNSETFDILSIKGETNEITVSHIKDKEETKALSKLKFTYKNGEIIKDTSILWNNDGLSLDNIEIDIDSSVMYIFKNGKLQSAILIDPIDRIAEKSTLIINGAEENYYSIEELIIKDKLQHKEDFIPSDVQLTHYDYSIPYIDYYFSSDKIALDSKFKINLDCSNKISLLLNYGGIYYYYINDSWRQSDGSFEQSNDSFTFEDYIKDFVFNGKEDFFIRAFFESDGSDDQFINKIYFDLDANSIYKEDEKTAAILVGIPTFEPIEIDPEPIDPGMSVIPDKDPEEPIDPKEDPDNPIDSEMGILPDPEFKEQNIELKDKSLVIKTDLGTTKIIFPKDMTIDEAIKFIEDAYPEGIAKVYKDSKYRAVLVSETKGEEAYIKVSEEAGDILFGDRKTAQGDDQSKNTLENDYKDFIDAIKKYSSNDLIPIEIDDEQLKMYLQEAINLYKKYRNDELNLYKIQLKGNSKDGYEIPSVVQDWHDITNIYFRPLFPIGFYTGSFDNDAEDIIELSLVNAMGGVDYSQFYGKGFQTDYYISLMNIESMEQILGLTPSWKVYNNRLYILPNTITKYCTVTIEYKAPIDPIKALRDPYIIQYCYGKIRMAQGEIRGQYGSQLSSGNLPIQFNADAMYERGKTAVDEAISGMKGEQAPLGFIMG